MQQELKENSIVWAKLKGFSWWPGVIGKIINKKTTEGICIKYLVNFIGQISHAIIGASHIKPFDPNQTTLIKNSKSQKVQEAIDIAKKMINGQSYESLHNEKMIKEPNIKMKPNNEFKENDQNDHKPTNKKDDKIQKEPNQTIKIKNNLIRKMRPTRNSRDADEKNDNIDKNNKNSTNKKTQDVESKKQNETKNMVYDLTFLNQVISGGSIFGSKKHYKSDRSNEVSKADLKTSSSPQKKRKLCNNNYVQYKEEEEAIEPKLRKRRKIDQDITQIKYSNSNDNEKKLTYEKSKYVINKVKEIIKPTRTSSKKEAGSDIRSKEDSINPHTKSSTDFKPDKHFLKAISCEIDDIALIIMMKANNDQAINDKNDELVKLNEIIVNLKNILDDIKPSLLMNCDIFRKLNCIKTIFYENHNKSGMNFENCEMNLTNIFNEYTNKILALINYKDDIMKNYEQILKTMQKSKPNAPKVNDELNTNSKSKKLVRIDRDIIIKDIKDLIINNNLVNQTLAEPFAKSIEEKIYNKVNTDDQYENTLKKFMSIIQANKTSVNISELAQVDMLLFDNMFL